MSVQSYLLEIASNAVLSSAEEAMIDTSILSIKARLSLWFGNEVNEAKQFGSSTRGTILPRSMDEKSDIDMLIVFSDRQYRPQTYIERIRRFAEEKYYSSEIGQSHPTVVLALNHIKFDLVPAISAWGGGYLIPAPSVGYSDWQATNPDSFSEQLIEKNRQHGFHLKRLIRLVKYWNSVNGYVYDSYDLERSIVNNLRYHLGFKEYVYYAFNELSLELNAAQWKFDKVARAKKVIEQTRFYEELDLVSAAENEIKKIIPPRA